MENAVVTALYPINQKNTEANISTSDRFSGAERPRCGTFSALSFSSGSSLTAILFSRMVSAKIVTETTITMAAAANTAV